MLLHGFRAEGWNAKAHDGLLRYCIGELEIDTTARLLVELDTHQFRLSANV